MKSKVLIFLVVATSLCLTARCQSAQSVQKIEFTTMTRGYQKQVFISPDSVIEIVDGRSDDHKVEKRKLDGESWDQLVGKLNDLKLSDIEALQAPSSRRAVDAAKHSTLKLIDQAGKSWEHTFDDQSPNEKLKPFMDYILQLTEPEQ